MMFYLVVVELNDTELLNDFLNQPKKKNSTSCHSFLHFQLKDVRSRIVGISPSPSLFLAMQ